MFNKFIEYEFIDKVITTHTVHSIHPSFSFQYRDNTEISSFLDELQNLSKKLTFSLGNADEVKSNPLEIKIIKPGDKLSGLYEKLPTHYIFKKDQLFFIEFKQKNIVTKASIEFSEYYQNEDFSKDMVEQLNDDYLRSEFIFWNNYFFFISHIARPNCLLIADSFSIEKNNEIKSLDPIRVDFSSSLQTAKKMNWPKMEKLDMLKVWKWANSFKDGLDLLGTTKVGRALSAFSHTFSSIEESSGNSTQLFWVILGLETLFTEGKNNLNQQLIEKTQILLGPQKEYKKLVKNLYNYRSRFLHGDLPFPNLFCQWEVGPEIDEYFDKSFQNLQIATAILLASLQWLAKNNKKELDFECIYKIKETKQ